MKQDINAYCDQILAERKAQATAFFFRETVRRWFANARDNSTKRAR